MPNKGVKNKEGQNKVTVNVMRVAGAWSRALPGYGNAIAAWSQAALAGAKGGALSVVLADDAFVRDLNHTYRGKDKATNVLSFCGEGEEIGDVVLALETLKREAKAQKKTLLAHTAHLVVHGCLHLLGHDHEKARDAQKMESLEVAILAALGFPDPYKTA